MVVVGGWLDVRYAGRRGAGGGCGATCAIFSVQCCSSEPAADMSHPATSTAALLTVRLSLYNLSSGYWPTYVYFCFGICM